MGHSHNSPLYAADILKSMPPKSVSLAYSQELIIVDHTHTTGHQNACQTLVYMNSNITAVQSV